MKMAIKVFFAALLSLGGVLLANTSLAAVIASKPTTAFHVRDLRQEGESKCDGGTWSFVIAWTPVVYKNELRLSYNFSSLAGSIKGPLQCTPEKCTVRFSGMHKRQKDAYARVQMAGIGSVSGVRIDRIPYVPNCN